VSSSKKSGGSYLIGTKRTFDVNRVVTIHGSLIELECVRIGCGGFFTYIPAVYLSLDVNSLSYVLFVEDVVAIVNRRKPTDKILVLEDFNMQKVEDCAILQPTNVATDLESKRGRSEQDQFDS
jgi:hypothetical protein